MVHLSHCRLFDQDSFNLLSLILQPVMSFISIRTEILKIQHLLAMRKPRNLRKNAYGWKDQSFQLGITSNLIKGTALIYVPACRYISKPPSPPRARNVSL